MIENLKKEIKLGVAPIHLLSVKEAKKTIDKKTINKFRISNRYKTNHLQIGTIYKSVI
ncbi:hypothetical protein ULMA_16030 [Patiriisocius marinus]|uniref:Uncharacterized protein n=1 Tax=Patiriisocius marinus TaxID=1397112 RepID=A0A5J4IPA5_9FLAO|nr:hypothetical protein ULMA_16030 [Patiriisocius marinus]